MTVTATATTEMNRIYRRQRHIYNFTRRYFLLGRDQLIERLAPRPTDSVLEIGCGTGRNLILAARRYPGTHFCGIDVSTVMLTSAIDAIARAGLSSQVRVAHADATRAFQVALFGKTQFERVFISYSVSMMPGWTSVLDRAMSLLAPRGELHIVDFGGQEGLPRWFRVGLRRWLAHFQVTPCDRLEADLQMRARFARASLVIERPYRGYAQYAVLKLGA